MSSRELYNMKIIKNNEKPTSQSYYDSFYYVLLRSHYLKCYIETHVVSYL